MLSDTEIATQVTVRNLQVNSGAGFLVVLTGAIEGIG